MAEHANPTFNGPESLEALTQDRERMWHGFTNATTAAVAFIVVLLVGMAIFLL
ncbi:MAG TPA: aa3-type cytochrome c oxidase subunit IV [Rhodopila sp.]|nr:aa3-type cytochrome c oxidase subunit IV [Rhodopila sp.]